MYCYNNEFEKVRCKSFADLRISKYSKIILDGKNLVGAYNNNPNAEVAPVKNDLEGLLFVLKQFEKEFRKANKQEIILVYKNEDEEDKPLSSEDKKHIAEILLIANRFYYCEDLTQEFSAHYEKSRDDLITLWLGQGDAVIFSDDNYRDYKCFSKIKPFTLYVFSKDEQRRFKITPSANLSFKSGHFTKKINKFNLYPDNIRLYFWS